MQESFALKSFNVKLDTHRTGFQNFLDLLVRFLNAKIKKKLTNILLCYFKSIGVVSFSSTDIIHKLRLQT